jgi:hypothetical protein
MYDNAPTAIRKFFDYYPGLTLTGHQERQRRKVAGLSTTKEAMRALPVLPHRYPTIFEWITNPQPQYLPSNNLSKLLSDQAHTTDNESSDEEPDNIHEINPQLANAGSQVYVARGVHFTLNHFDHAARQAARSPQYHNAPTYSAATIVRAQTNYNNAYLVADSEVKNYLTALKQQPVGRERGPDGRLRPVRAMSATTKYEHLIHVYVNRGGYDDLFNTGGMQRNFGFYNNHNPFISTSHEIEKAKPYASGLNIAEKIRYEPKMRESTYVLKHKRLGYVVEYYIPYHYYQAHALDIDTANVRIGQRFAQNREVIIHSCIPQPYVYRARIISKANNRSDHNETSLRLFSVPAIPRTTLFPVPQPNAPDNLIFPPMPVPQAAAAPPQPPIDSANDIEELLAGLRIGL